MSRTPPAGRDDPLSHKLNKVHHDPQAGALFIALRPRSQRRPEATLECPGKVLLDLDEEGDVYGIRLLGVPPAQAEEIIRRLKAV